MARYYFLIENDVIVPDNEGSEHATLDAAKREAVRIMAEVLPDNCHRLFGEETLRVITLDETGLVLFTVETDAFIAPVLRQTAR